MPRMSWRKSATTSGFIAAAVGALAALGAAGCCAWHIPNEASESTAIRIRDIPGCAFPTAPSQSVGPPLCGFIANQSGGPVRRKKSRIHLLFPPALAGFRLRLRRGLDEVPDPATDFGDSSRVAFT